MARNEFASSSKLEAVAIVVVLNSEEEGEKMRETEGMRRTLTYCQNLEARHWVYASPMTRRANWEVCSHPQTPWTEGNVPSYGTHQNFQSNEHEFQWLACINASVCLSVPYDLESDLPMEMFCSCKFFHELNMALMEVSVQSILV